MFIGSRKGSRFRHIIQFLKKNVVLYLEKKIISFVLLIRQLSPLPSARTLNGLIVMRGKLYAVGGKVEHVYQTKEMLCYNPTGRFMDLTSQNVQVQIWSRYDEEFYVLVIMVFWIKYDDRYQP